MHQVKNQIRRLVSDLLATTTSTRTNGCCPNEKLIVFNHQLIKNCFPAPEAVPNKLKPLSSACLVEVKATDLQNARQIADKILKHKDDLQVLDVAIKETPSRKEGYQNVVFVKFDARRLLPGVLKIDKAALTAEAFGQMNYCEATPANPPLRQLAERLVIDFSSPNVAKPFHFGHLRSTIVGNYLANLNSFLGNQVTKLNYIGDWGMQYGILSLGLDTLKPDNSTLAPLVAHSNDIDARLRDILSIYVQASERASNDQEFLLEAKKRFHAMETEQTLADTTRWLEIRQLSLDELERAYGNLGIEFDVYEYESSYAKREVCAELLAQLKSKGVAEFEEDRWILRWERNGRWFETPLTRSDGVSLYLLRDLAAALHRKKEFDFDRMLYVVGVEQERHFYALIRGYNQLVSEEAPSSLQHVQIGHILGMKTREGKFVLLSDLLTAATERYIQSTRDSPTSKISKSSHSQTKLDAVGRDLALSALFVYLMRSPRIQPLAFSLEYVLNTGARSGINLQATYARLRSLIRKAREEVHLEPAQSAEELTIDGICTEEAMGVLSTLGELGTALHASYWMNDPSNLVNHGLSLCHAVNKARQTERLRVVGEPDERFARTRLTLFAAACDQIEFIIKMIGLKPLDKV